MPIFSFTFPFQCSVPLSDIILYRFMQAQYLMAYEYQPGNFSDQAEYCILLRITIPPSNNLQAIASKQDNICTHKWFQ